MSVPHPRLAAWPSRSCTRSCMRAMREATEHCPPQEPCPCVRVWIAGATACSVCLAGVMVAWAGAERLALGLSEPPPSAEDAASGWVEVRARWPLTAEKHPRCAAIVRSRALRAPRKPSRIPCEPLTDMTRVALAAAAEQSGGTGGGKQAATA